MSSSFFFSGYTLATPEIRTGTNPNRLSVNFPCKTSNKCSQKSMASPECISHFWNGAATHNADYPLLELVLRYTLHFCHKGESSFVIVPAEQVGNVLPNRRLVALDERGVTFRWKDYRISGRTRYKTMTLSPEEFMRRFLLHVLPGGFHRIRHYGLLANGERRKKLAKARELLSVEGLSVDASLLEIDALGSLVQPTFVCPCCGSPMRIIETFLRGQPIRAPPPL